MQGDSGGPLIYNGQLVAVVSAGDGQCGAGNPDIFTKLSSFIPYIENEMKDSESSGQGSGLDMDTLPQLPQQPQIPQQEIVQQPFYPWQPQPGVLPPPVILIPSYPIYQPILYA